MRPARKPTLSQKAITTSKATTIDVLSITSKSFSLSKPVRISEPYVNVVDIKGNNIGFDVCPCCYNKGIDIEDVADQDDKQAEDG